MTLPEIVVDISPKKGKFRDGQAYVAFSRVTSLDKLHILNYTHDQIWVTKNIEEQMSCNSTKILPNLPKPMISTSDKQSCVVLVHLNVSGVQSKVLDIQNDETLKLEHVLYFNETHLSKNQNLTTEMLGFQDNYEIYWKDRNQHGGGVMLLVH